MQNGTRLGSIALSTCLLACVASGVAGCVAEPDYGWGEDSLREPGPWDLPRTTREEGERQNVRYDAAPPWNGGRNCSGRLLEGTREVGDYLERRFRQIRFAGGYSCRQNTADLSQTSVHGTGRALDLMLPTIAGDADNGAGDPIANWLVEHAEDLGVQYIIWDHWDWNGSLSGRKDTPYGGPIPHVDHIHVELTVEAARRQTRWFTDRDGDGVRNERDNCTGVANAAQDDGDRDGVGNRCDNCPHDSNAHQLDADGDGVGDRCDNCPHTDNPGQDDGDGDGVGNRCEDGAGEDGRGGGLDALPDDCILSTDADGDGLVDDCDLDVDGDTVLDDVDTCLGLANPEQLDSDADGIGDACDPDPMLSDMVDPGPLHDHDTIVEHSAQDGLEPEAPATLTPRPVTIASCAAAPGTSSSAGGLVALLALAALGRRRARRQS